jgi:hypothetical protein
VPARMAYDVQTGTQKLSGTCNSAEFNTIKQIRRRGKWRLRIFMKVC